jgi:leader peptidase (prepilin peptidase) / N-methyltransferase
VGVAEAVTVAGAALAGLIAGRLVVLAIAWLPRYDPPRRLPSPRCPHGAARLRPADLVPLAGWRSLRARCPACAASGDAAPRDAVSRPVAPGGPALGAPVPGSTVPGEAVPASAGPGGAIPASAGPDWAFPGRGAWAWAAEVGTAAVLAAQALVLGPHLVLVAYCYLGVTGVALAFIDARCRRLPDALTLPAYPAGLVLLGIAALTSAGGGRHYLEALAGMAAAWLLFAVQALAYPAGVGWGDVKLSGVIGLYLGWLGIGPLVAGVFAGYLLAAVTGAGLLIARRASRGSPIPFGPFLLAGALLAILLSGVVGSRF